MTWPLLLMLALTATAAVYAFLGGIVFFYQHRILYRPRRKVLHTPKELDLDFEDLDLTTEDGLRIHGWFIPYDNAPGTVLFFHGNKGNIGDRLEFVRLIRNLGLNLLLFDYRGYGNSEGIPGEQGTYLDAWAGWKYLTKERRIAPESIILFGRSLGAAVAVHLAARTSCAGLIVESAFSSFPDIARSQYPWLPTRHLTRYRYPSVDEIKKVSVPVLVAHSPEDKVIPFDQGERLYEAANEPKFFVSLKGTHATAFVVTGQPYEDALQAFVAKTLGKEQ